MQNSFTILPTTKLGRLSVILILLMPLLFTVAWMMLDFFYVDVPAGDTIIADISARPVLSLGMIAGMFSGFGAFVTGLISLVRKRERSVFVIISTLLGAFVSAFWMVQVFG